MHEVAQAVKRANLQVDTVFALHQGPMPWNQLRTENRELTTDNRSLVIVLAFWFPCSSPP